jgi:AAA family ATP:ADP antiporter
LPAEDETMKIVELLLRPVARTRQEEIPTVALLTLTLFLQLSAYYILKVVREPLIMAGGGAEVKRYSSAGQVVLIALVLPLYNSLARRWSGTRLVVTVHAFFIANLLIFFTLARAGVPLAVPYYLWVGVFNVALVAQFWALANDIYSAEQGERLFAVLGLGGSLGAVAGAHVAGWLLPPLGPPGLMLVATAILGLCAVLVLLVRRRATRRGPRPRPGNEGHVGGQGLLHMFARDRYLVFIGVLTLLVNWVNSTGEYILDRTLPGAAAAANEDLGQYVGVFRARFFGRVNLISLLLQAFAVSHLIRLLGVPGSLSVLPAIALGGYSTVALLPVLSVITAVKVAENSLNYSLQNTARQALFLVTDRAAKFLAKTVTDTLFWRGGDLLAAALVFIGTRFAFDTRQFVVANLVLVLGWALVMVGIWRTHRRRLPVVEGSPA